MSDKSPAIVVVAFNRPRSLQRLLDSLQLAFYPAQDIPLIISIDKCDTNQDVLDIAEHFDWKFGPKEVHYQEKNLGLRDHVMQCGDLTKQFGAIIMLEDDLFVSPNFYYYTLNALHFSSDKLRIGGISLYNHQLNVHTNKNFQPIEDGYDNWYFQFASSWGQAWNAKQWKSFKEWYQTTPKIDSNTRIPEYVRGWSEKSWLKYFIAFLVAEDRYFIYPKIALTTNFSDTGTHVGEDSTAFQLPLLYAHKKEYHFSKLSESCAVYDAYYENTALAEKLQIPKQDLCLDLQAYKNVDTLDGERFLLTTQHLNFRILKKMACSLKPIDANVLQDLEGEDIFLYDLHIREPNTFIRSNKSRMLTYNFKYIYLNEALTIVMSQLRGKFKRATKKIFK
ncbi:MAG: glycosyltransferase [Allomuricauda sp.]|nr:MAG: glycosyltransferase [Allomuricauda sp.]